MDPPRQLPESVESLDFPEFVDPIVFDPSIMADLPTPTNRLVEQVVKTPETSRHPSPQPTHFSVPTKNGNGNGHRVLRSATVGYIAPEFKGKKAQMSQGQ